MTNVRFELTLPLRKNSSELLRLPRALNSLSKEQSQTINNALKDSQPKAL